MAYCSAIIGYGGMGGWHHENIAARVPEIRVKGAWDIRPEMLEKAEEKGLYPYKSLEELLNDRELDLVTIAVPNNFHKELAIACLEHGKNVVCEKPVTLNAAELTEIIAVAEKTGRLFAVHQNRRWDKDFRIVKTILEQNTIGKPYYIESRVQGSRRAMHGWRSYKVNGGGMVYDWGVHLFDQLLWVLPGRVTQVYAQLFQVFSDEVDDNFKAMLRMEDGTSVLVEIATNCFINQPRWHVCCTDGTAVVEDWQCNGKIVRLNTDEEMGWDDEIVYTEAGPTRTMAPRPVQTTEVLPLPQVESDWSDYYKNIVGVLNGTAELIVKPEQSLRVMRLIDCVFESAREGRSIVCNI